MRRAAAELNGSSRHVPVPPCDRRGGDVGCTTAIDVCQILCGAEDRPVIGLRPDVAIAALILLPATGVAIWAWTTLTRLEQDLRALSGFEGKHFEIGHPTTRSAERSESPIPQSGNSSTPRARMLRWISLEPP